jgi:hypothetical protein
MRIDEGSDGHREGQIEAWFAVGKGGEGRGKRGPAIMIGTALKLTWVKTAGVFL